MKFTKNKLTSFVAVITVLCIAIGAVAYFTDRVQAPASATTAAVKTVIDVTPDPENDPNGEKEPGEALEAVWAGKNQDKFVVPGDQVDLSYNLKNIGNCDIDVKETIILTSSIPLTQSAPEWRLFHTASPDKYGAMEGGEKIEVEQISEYQIKYTLPAFMLAKDATQPLSYILVFDKYAGNPFQGQTCTVDYLVELRQHVPTIAVDSGWDTIRTDRITFAGIAEYKVVPAAPAG